MLMPNIVVPTDMQEVVVPEMVYKDLRRPDYGAKVSLSLARYDDGTFAGGLTQKQAIQALDELGFQLPPLSLLQYLAEQEGMDSPVFDDGFGRNPEKTYFYDHTTTKLVTPAGWEPERMDGGKYPRDVYEYIDRKWVQVAEDQRIPGENSIGFLRIKEVNPITRIPSETTDSDAEYLGYWYFSPQLSESIVLVGTSTYVNSSRGCLYINAANDPSVVDKFVGFRFVSGVIPPVVKI